MNKTLISLGANLGNARQTLRLAGEMMIERWGNDCVRFSRVYRTPAVGGPAGQGDFLNAVATVESEGSVFECWKALHAIEQDLGRTRRHRWEARRIDLDVLLHNGERIWTPTLKVPHPRMAMRTFVLEPACEIASSWIDPVTTQTLAQLATNLRRLSPEANPSSLHIFVVVESAALYSRFESLQPHPNLTLAVYDQVPRPSEHPTSRIDSKHAFCEWVAKHAERRPFQLLVVLGASPDPTLIHWEDYCRVWATYLDIVPEEPWLLPEDRPTASSVVSYPLIRAVPKYLLPADNAVWAKHELEAALQAMTCPVLPCGSLLEGSSLDG